MKTFLFALVLAMVASPSVAASGATVPQDRSTHSTFGVTVRVVRSASVAVRTADIAQKAISSGSDAAAFDASGHVLPVVVRVENEPAPKTVSTRWVYVFPDG